MDYFIVVNGQKQGPFDIIALIKKAKTGGLNADTLVSTSSEGPFIPAAQVAEVMDLLQDHHGSTPEPTHKAGKLKLKKVLADGIDLWSRHVISFTIFAGVILAAGFGISEIAAGSVFLTQYHFIPNYIVTFVTSFLYLLLFYYILLSKRSQKLDGKEITAGINRGLVSLLTLSFIFSLFTLAYFFGELVGHLALIIVCLLLSFFIFAPFIIFDGEKSLARALRLSAGRVSRMGSDNLGVIVTLMGINVMLAFVPGIIMPDLFGFGLFISLPVTVSSLAFIYDEYFG